MDTVWLSLQGAWDLLRYGLVVGAGLPILFALGVRFMAGPAVEEGAVAAGPSAGGRALSWIFFALCLLGVIVGIEIIVGAGMGKIVDFFPFPHLVDKPK